MANEKTTSSGYEMLDEKIDKVVSSVNPANLQSDAGMFKEMFRFHGLAMGTVKPAVVLKADREEGTVEVQPLLLDPYMTEDKLKYKKLDPIKGLPVLRFQHGMFLVDAPLYPCDTGYVVAGHRDGSLAVDGNSKPVLEAGDDGKAQSNNLGPQPPNTYLLHRYENGFFVPCRWGTVEVDEKDKDSLVLARYRNQTKEIERDGKKVEVYDGVEGKVTLEKDGTVRIVNGSGEIIESDEYRKAEEGETPDKTDADGVGWKRKPTVYIDPTADLTKSDARFRLVEMPSGNGYVGEDGNLHIPTKKVRVLADEGVEEGKEIVVPPGGNGEENVLEDVNISSTSYVKDANGNSVPLKVSKSWDGKTINFGLELGREIKKGYCNSISGGESDNEISGWSQVEGGNGISRTPCGDGGESGDSGE